MAMAESEGVSNSLSPMAALPDGEFIAVDAVVDGEYESILLFR
jgi:hypothetical protein